MNKQYTRKTFPTWTPPIFGYQYRWTLDGWALERNKWSIKTATVDSPPIFLTYYWDAERKAHQWTGTLWESPAEAAALVAYAETLDGLVAQIEAKAKELHNELGELLGHD